MSNANQRSLLSELLFSVDDDAPRRPKYPAATSQMMASSIERTKVPFFFIDETKTTPKSGPQGIVKRRRRTYRNPNHVVATNVANVQQVQRPTENISLTPAQADEIERCKETLRGFGFQNPDAAYQQMTFYFRYILPRLRQENVPTGRDDDLPVTDEMLHYHFSRVMSQQPRQQQEEVELPI